MEAIIDLSFGFEIYIPLATRGISNWSYIEGEAYIEKLRRGFISKLS